MPGERRGTALITGASMGLGLEYAKLFAQDGHTVVLVARSEERLRAIAADLSSRHEIRGEVIRADLVDPGAPGRIADEIDRRGLTVDFLVNNAGFGTNGVFAELDLERELGVIQVNVTALVHLTRLILPGMIARGWGRILNIGSTAGFQAGPRMATYYATKAFVLSFSEAIAHEARGTGVTVTCHCPGATATGFATTANNADSNLFKAAVADAASVAKDGYLAMQRGKVVAVAGPMNWMGTQMLRLAPRALVRSVVGRLNQRG